MTHEKTREDTHGLYLLHTGNGKGKSSAALNLVYRHLAHGKSAAVFFFVKNPDNFDYGDIKMLEVLRSHGYPVTITMMGAGFTWVTGDTEEVRQLACNAWELASGAIMDPKIDLVVCDELHIALHYHQLPLEPVLETLTKRPKASHVVTTGRNAPDALVAIADLVTEFTEVKHPYHAGVKAQRGIEF
jgi:cob(I)alamin adenosyltransferase